MAQLSRPFQIALVAVGLLAAVWLFALRGHSSTSGQGSTPAASTPATPAAEAPKAATPSPTYHGSAPGVAGLSRAVTKAHEAVSTSQQNAKQLEQKSAQASGATPTPTGVSTTASPTTPATSAGGAKAPATKASPSVSSAPKHATPPRRGAASSAPAAQQAVEAELKQGKIAIVLFWNPKGADDLVTHRALQQMVRLHHNAGTARAAELSHGEKFFGMELGRKIAVHESPAGAVASYGTVTRGVQVFGTPTIVIINPKHRATVLTGSTDAYSIEQAIAEARGA
ncbi:MAG: hypothetical protein JWL67_67 [Solirubrobacterales bacterium]|jgi:hypothetical protein|nr:hypothetical protein [Solirubrobacterales bacterium]